MDDAGLRALKQRAQHAWNAQDVDRVLTCYTEDLIYRDPNTRGELQGSPAMRRYLVKLFDGWRMHWTLRDVYPFEGRGGCAVTWHASFQRPGGSRTVETDGMDLVLLRDGRIQRNEVHFDRSVLVPLL